ncbi:MAG TPA: hypothetical protein VM848_08125 [Acidimicrobiia bacterium]|nr:hypothetical protein [Acidimicrobiia bacterium]
MTIVPRNSLESFVEAYGEAISSSDLERVADSWGIPALVLSDHGTTVVNTKEDVMGFFEKAAASYKSQGRMFTIGEIISKEYLTKNIVALDVRWPSFDDQLKAKAVEMSHYLLRIGDDGKPRIQVALTRSVG